MSPGLAVLAVAVVAGGVVAVASRESRVAVLGVVLAGVTAPLLGSPLPSLLALAVRVVAMLLGGYLLWAALRGNPPTRGSRLGWPVEALIAAAAAIAGYGAIRVLAGEAPAPIDGPAPVLVEQGPREALAAGAALGALAVGPILVGRDALRVGMGLLLVVLAADLVRVGLAGSPSGLGHVVIAGLTVALSAAAATISSGALRTGGTLEVSAARRAAAGPAAPWQRPRPQVADAPEPPGDDAAGAGVSPRSGVGRRSIPGR